MLNLFRKGYRPKVNDVVIVNTLVDKDKLYRIDQSSLHKIIQVNRRKEEVKIVKVNSQKDRGIEGWTVRFSDVEPFNSNNREAD